MARDIGANTRFTELLTQLGIAGLSSLYPKDFEVYMIGFELVDSTDKTLSFLSLPITPSNITINEPEITNIKKVSGGVTSLKTDSFVPKNIQINGNFGRRFKTLIRDQVVDLGSFFGSLAGGLNLVNGDFQGPTVKTGYGTTKVFQELLDNSTRLDQLGQPVRLYFYNFTFGENYVVEVITKDFSQSRESNIIWNYNVMLKAVAPINNTIRSEGSLRSILTTNLLQSGVNNLASSITNGFL